MGAGRKNIALIIKIAVISVIAVCGIIVFQKCENHKAQQAEVYANELAGKVFHCIDSVNTASKGTARFYYTLYLNEDGKCRIHFKYSKNNDNSVFSSNKTESFYLENLTWKVQAEGNKFCVRIGGDMDWKDYSNAKLDRALEIYENDLITLRGRRNGDLVVFTPVA